MLGACERPHVMHSPNKRFFNFANLRDTQEATGNPVQVHHIGVGFID
jgi:hypothetical protein